MKIPLAHYVNIQQMDNPPDIVPLLKDAQSQPCINHDEDVDITRTDWHMGNDFTRPWVKVFMPHLVYHLEQYIKPFHAFMIQDIWFQQYDNGSQHGWHTHSHNFTGVYYVTHPTSHTELIEPYTQKAITLPVKHNDVVVFPSTTIHRAPPASNKIIISFNFNAFYHYKVDNSSNNGYN